MATLGFRPRPIDINKQMPIFRGDPPEEEAAGYTAVRGVPQMPTGMESDEEEEAHIQEAIHAANHAAQRHDKQEGRGGHGHGHDAIPGVEIPTPGCYIVKTYEAETPVWKRPDNYVLYTAPTTDELDEAVEYDMDDADEAFAQSVGLAAEKLERLVDRIEKLAGYADGDAPTLQALQPALAPDALLRDVPPATLRAVLAYWQGRREGNAGAPFVERFRKPPAPDDPSPYRAFRVREKERAHKKKALGRNDEAAYDRMLLLRQDLDRLRALLDLIRRREVAKRNHIGVLRHLADARIADTTRRAARRRGSVGGEWASESESGGSEEASEAAQGELDEEEPDGDEDADAAADDDDEAGEADALEERMRRALSSASLLGDEPDDAASVSVGYTTTRALRRERERERQATQVEWDESLLGEKLLAASAYSQDLRRRHLEADAERGAPLRLPDGSDVRGRVRWGRGGRVVFERFLPPAPLPSSCVRPAASLRATLTPPDAEDDELYAPPPLAHLSPYNHAAKLPPPSSVSSSAQAHASLLPPPSSSSSASSAPIPAAASSSSLHAPHLLSTTAPSSSPSPSLPLLTPLSAPLSADSTARRGRWRAPPLLYPHQTDADHR